MAITYECNLGSDIDCYLYDGMVSNLSSYLTANFIKPLVAGNIYSLSFKATSTNDPNGTEVRKYNEYVFKYTGKDLTLNISSGGTTHVFVINSNSIKLTQYGGNWYYIWCRVYGAPFNFPSNANY